MRETVYLKRGSLPTRFSFIPKAKPKHKAPLDRSSLVGVGRVTDQLKTQSYSVEILPQEAAIFVCQESELPSVATPKLR